MTLTKSSWVKWDVFKSKSVGVSPFFLMKGVRVISSDENKNDFMHLTEKISAIKSKTGTSRKLLTAMQR